jgi:hypothetical protein
MVTWKLVLDGFLRIVVSVSLPPLESWAVPLIVLVTELVVAAKAVPVMASAAAMAMDVLMSLMRAA